MNDRTDWLMESDAYKLGKAMGSHDRQAGNPSAPDGPFTRPGPNHTAFTEGYKAAFEADRNPLRRDRNMTPD